MRRAPPRILGIALLALAAAVLLALRACSRRSPAAPPAGPARSGAPLPFTLTDVTRAAGLLHRHGKFVVDESLSNIAPWLTAYDGGVAVVDFDGDGWPDIYLTSAAPGSRNRLFRNNHDGTFTDAAERAGLADVNRGTGSARPLFFDYDNDGSEDLLLTTYNCARLFHNDGRGVFADVTEKSGLRHCGFAPASNVLDYDGDGRLDVVIGDYFKPVDLAHPADFRFMHHGFRHSDNGGRAALFHNDGGGRFSRVRGNLGLSAPMWNIAIGVYDLRGTGRPDLHFALDYRVDALYYNDGRRFVDASAELADTDSLSSMSSEIADPFNEGRPSIFVSEIWAPPYVPEGNVLWRMTKEGRFKDVAEETGVRECGWAWGAKFADLDNDGWQDLVVVNGYVSADPGKSYWDAMDGLARSVREEGADLTDARSWPAFHDASMEGYQQSCVFRNEGGKRFVDVAAATGMGGRTDDGRGLAVIDYRNDGSLSLVENNLGQEARLYRTEQKNRNRWLGFRLRGTRSNRDAFGAEVRVRLRGGLTLTRQLQPANGYMSQSDARLHFGLGPDPVVEAVTVRWPSGAVQHLAPPPLDRYHEIVEPGGR